MRAMRYLKYFAFVIAIVLVMVACNPDLSESELNIITRNIPKELYKEEVSEIGDRLSEYLSDAVSEYSELLGDQTQKDIDERNAVNAFFGGNMFDVAELFGSSTNQMIANQYYNYIHYVNSHMSEMTDMAIGMTGILGEHPEFIKQFNGGLQETISLEIFNNLNNVPSSVSGSSMDFGELTLDDTDKEDWGAILMGDYRKPQISVPAVLYASILAVKSLKKPSPVYAVYDDEIDSWDVGYDNRRAVSVTFETKGDILFYEYQWIQYHDVYIDSDLNVLNTK